MGNQDNSKLILAYERLHADYQYLADEYEALKAKAQHMEKMLWITQLDRERYKNETIALKRRLQDQQG